MKKVKFKLVCFVSLLLLVLSACQSKSDERPNIVLILADDMGYSDLGCYGSEIHTPNLDKLASDGVRFSSFYNNARCCPSRATILTGLYPHQAGIGAMTDTDVPIPEYEGYFKEGTITIADILRQAGYSTYMAGKWHVGDEPEHRPVHHGFDKSFALIDGACGYFDYKPYRNDKWPPGNKLTVVEDDHLAEIPDSFYATDLYTQKAIGMIEGHTSESPFFLYMAYTAPHWPMHALEEDVASYYGRYDKGWDSIRAERYQRLEDLGLIHPATSLSPKNKPDRDWTKLSPDQQKYEARLMEVYAAMVDRMDQNIGKLIEELKKKNMLDNTVILFLSDNGGCAAGNLAGGYFSDPRFDPKALPGTPQSFTGYGKNWANVSNTPFREFKTDIHEGGIATPFIGWFPKKFQKGSINRSTAHIADILPTLVDLAGTTYPVDVVSSQKPDNGISLVPMLEQNEMNPERTLYFEHFGNCGVIQGDWKLVKFRRGDWELYNIGLDRSESNNLASENPEKLNELIELYWGWADKNKVLPPEEVEAASPYKW